jgi:hypothetical protein
MLQRLGRFLASVGFGNLLLGSILVLSALNLYSSGQILESLRRGDTPVSTTYADQFSQSHTVTSPMQEDPVENVRVHKQYLKAAFCAFPPMVNPDWFNPETDCP